MTPCDAGALVAIIDRKDRDHDRCVAAATNLPRGPLVTTWPCFTEAMYLGYRTSGCSASLETGTACRLG